MIIHKFELQNVFAIKRFSELINDAIRKTTTWSGSRVNLLYFISFPITIISWYSKLNLRFSDIFFVQCGINATNNDVPPSAFLNSFTDFFSSKWFYCANFKTIYQYMTIRFHSELSKLPSALIFQHGGAIILTHLHVQFRWNNVMLS